jgi:hypothetical protein
MGKKIRDTGISMYELQFSGVRITAKYGNSQITFYLDKSQNVVIEEYFMVGNLTPYTIH